MPNYYFCFPLKIWVLLELFFLLFFILLCPPQQVISFEPQNLEIDIFAGTDLKYDISIKNTGGKDATVRFEAVGIDQDWIDPCMDPINIPTGNTMAIPINIHVIDAPSGSYKGYIALKDFSTKDILEMVPIMINVIRINRTVGVYCEPNYINIKTGKYTKYPIFYNISVKNIGSEVVNIGYSAVGINQSWIPSTPLDKTIGISPGKSKIITIKIKDAPYGNQSGLIAIWNNDSDDVLEHIPITLNLKSDIERQTGIPPTIIQQPTDATITFGIECATFTVEADGTPPLKYQWFKDGKEIAGEDSLSYTYVHPDTTMQGYKGTVYEYYVNVSNQFDSVSSKTARLSFR